MTGLFFGSFNPIHNGHLKIAQYLLYKGYCQRIWFVVSPHNPLKSDRSLLDEQKRLEIVKAAIRGDERMQACDVEFGLPKPSYTYATLQLLKNCLLYTSFRVFFYSTNAGFGVYSFLFSTGITPE